MRNLANEVRDRYPRVDVLMNNAGAMYTTRQVTNDGIELTWAVNHLAPFRSKLGIPQHQGLAMCFLALAAYSGCSASYEVCRAFGPC